MFKLTFLISSAHLCQGMKKNGGVKNGWCGTSCVASAVENCRPKRPKNHFNRIEVHGYDMLGLAGSYWRIDYTGTKKDKLTDAGLFAHECGYKPDYLFKHAEEPQCIAIHTDDQKVYKWRVYERKVPDEAGPGPVSREQLKWRQIKEFKVQSGQIPGYRCNTDYKLFDGSGFYVYPRPAQNEYCQLLSRKARDDADYYQTTFQEIFIQNYVGFRKKVTRFTRLTDEEMAAYKSNAGIKYMYRTSMVFMNAEKDECIEINQFLEDNVGDKQVIGTSMCFWVLRVKCDGNWKAFDTYTVTKGIIPFKNHNCRVYPRPENNEYCMPYTPDDGKYYKEMKPKKYAELDSFLTKA